MLIAVGALIVLVSLFLDWFSPQINAWKAFELVDLLLATIAVAALVGGVGESFGRPGPLAGGSERLLPAIGVVAVVLVVAAIVNHPPAAIGRTLEVGIWIGLIGAILLVAGAAMSAAQISLVVTLGSRRQPPAHAASEPLAPPAPAAEPPTDERASIHDEPTRRVETERPR